MKRMVLIIGLGICIYWWGYQNGLSEVPKNCGEMGALFLELSKSRDEITDFGSEEWNDLIERETKFTNLCNELFER